MLFNDSSGVDMAGYKIVVGPVDCLEPMLFNIPEIEITSRSRDLFFSDAFIDYDEIGWCCFIS